MVEISLDREKAKEGILQYLPSDVDNTLSQTALFSVDNRPTECSLSPLEDLLAEINQNGNILSLPNASFAVWSVYLNADAPIELPMITTALRSYVCIPSYVSDPIVRVEYATMPNKYISKTIRIDYSFDTYDDAV